MSFVDCTWRVTLRMLIICSLPTLSVLSIACNVCCLRHRVMDGSIIKVHCRAACPSKVKLRVGVSNQAILTTLSASEAAPTTSFPKLESHASSSNCDTQPTHTHACPIHMLAAADSSLMRHDSPAYPQSQPQSNPTSPNNVTFEPGLGDTSSASHISTKSAHLSPPCTETADTTPADSVTGGLEEEFDAGQASRGKFDSMGLTSEIAGRAQEDSTSFISPSEQVQKRVRV